ncbi:MAG: diaminopimelate epimerase [Candidatus Omnitrophica bacterium]|nr:diaminopimelate epimerase [Candidatus Omnitrophota bacterium]
MASTFNFFKMQASGNDFVVVDNRKKAVKKSSEFTRKVCALHTGVGADGVLLVEKSRKADFKMRIINADGSEAEACGNGFRCIGLFAHAQLGFPASFTFETLAGLVKASVKGKRVRVRMVKPKDLRERGHLNIGGRKLPYSFLNTGVPHAVVFTQGLDGIDVNALGRAIREHQDFKPRGTNANFVEIKNSREIRVRTYERGVEQETQACGTGSTASAILSALRGHTKPPIKVHTRGGEILNIDFKINGQDITDVDLEGEAHFVFEGKISV